MVEGNPSWRDVRIAFGIPYVIKESKDWELSVVAAYELNVERVTRIFESVTRSIKADTASSAAKRK